MLPTQLNELRQLLAHTMQAIGVEAELAASVRHPAHGQSLPPQGAGISSREQDDGQTLPGSVLELLAQPVQAGIFGPVQMHEQQGRCALTLDDLLGFTRILNDAERAQSMGFQQPGYKLANGRIRIEQQDGVLLLDQRVFAAIGCVAAKAEGNLEIHREKG